MAVNMPQNSTLPINPYSNQGITAPNANNTKSSVNNPIRTLPKGTYYDIHTGKKVSNPNTYTGTVIGSNGVGIYSVVGGQIKNTVTPTTRTTINAGGKERPIYYYNNGYYYFDGTNVRQLTDSKQIKLAQDNEKITLIAKKSDPVGLERVTTKEEKKEETPSKPTNSTNNGTTSKPSSTPKETYDSTYKSLYDNAMKKLDELVNPKVIGAEEAAKLYGINYNEQAILDMYNEATNEYYDKKVAEQDSLRTNFARNNSQYYDQIADSYVDGYKNAAPTAAGKGTLAANALSTMLSAGRTNSENDYGMLQSVHGYEQDRKAELENNPLLAREYYNKIGTYLSTLSATKNAADVKQTVADLDAYSDRYAADRMYQAYQADEAATKYSGLAGAKITKASNSSGNVSDWQAMWNYYNSIGGSDYASKKTNTILKDYMNSNSK